MSTIGAIILAAGNSSRMGRPKQLLPYRDTTLLGNILHEVIKSTVEPVVVVLGANADLIEPDIKELPITIALNPEWKSGMASSIRAGMDRILQENPLLAGVLVLVADQPFVTEVLLNQLITAKRKSGKPIVACSYEGTLGTPALFSRHYFKHLMPLKGKEGAKKVLEAFHDKVHLIPFQEGAIDIDTEQDYKDLL